MPLSENTKKKIGVFTLLLMCVGMLAYTGKVIAEYYVLKYGDPVRGIVIDALQVCRHKKKSVILLIEGKEEKIRLYGPRCRSGQFKPGSTVWLRQSKSLGMLVLPGNQNAVRLVFFILFSGLLLWCTIGYVKSLRTENAG